MTSDGEAVFDADWLAERDVHVGSEIVWTQGGKPLSYVVTAITPGPGEFETTVHLKTIPPSPEGSR